MKGMTAPRKKITWSIIYIIKVNYTMYNYKSYKSTWTSLKCKLLFMIYTMEESSTCEAYWHGFAKDTKEIQKFDQNYFRLDFCFCNLFL